MKKNHAIKYMIALFVMMVTWIGTGITVNAETISRQGTVQVPICDNAISPDSYMINKQYTIPANTDCIIPLKVSAKGSIVTTAVMTGAYGIWTALYSDAACTQEVDNFGNITDCKRTDFLTVEKKGTYYLHINNRWDSPRSVSIGFALVNGENRTINLNKTVAVHINDNQDMVYHKIKATKTGYITVTSREEMGISSIVKILDSKKKAVSFETDVSDSQYGDKEYNSMSFGVKKGKTYYVGVTAAAQDVCITFQCKQVAVKEKSGAKKSKAVTIKKNKTVKGTLLADGKKSGTDWYKIKLSKSRILKLYVTGKATNTGGIKVEIIPASKSYKLYYALLDLPQTGKASYQSYYKLKKGTYYIKVYKSDKKESGYYTLKWK